MRRGVTLIEVLLTVALLSILAGLSLPATTTLLSLRNLDSATATLVQTLRRAALLSQSGAADSQWGVATDGNRVTLFRGASYAARDQGADEISSPPAGVTFSGDTEAVFEKVSGTLVTAKTITIHSSHESQSISISQTGVVSY